MEVDLVYLWVDGSDPKWQKKRNAITGNEGENSDINCKGRFFDNDELKYSLRSVEKYAPWIRKIFIVTDNQIPNWLDITNSKIKIIDHTDMLPQESLPCFNSDLIEKFLYKIPGLAEHFLYANDDTFINKPIYPHTFFAEDGFPIVRFCRKPFRKIRWYYKVNIQKKTLQNYKQKIENASKLVEKKYGTYHSGLPHHNIDAYLKSDYKRVVEDIFADKFKEELEHHIRNSEDTQRIIFLYVALSEKRGHLHYVSKKESLDLHIYKDKPYKDFEKYQPVLFCMNDSQHVQDSDRVRAKAFLDNRFPEKSKFEK